MTAYESKVLIDSSVWIKYFKEGDRKLETLISEDLISTNELILTEIVPVLLKQKQEELVDLLMTIDCIPLKINWMLLRQYQLINLNNGINKVGIPDLIILQQVIETKVSFFSLDDHFRLMNKHLIFDLVSDQPDL
ncbi:MAG: PIN domain-containing protein [Bacteroidetes bacterium]|nr:PIN domain-containing protein [Bacteroidota bacterium]MDA1121849.1 PIN domain-containing protein [Bacteroidota bacterium]